MSQGAHPATAAFTGCHPGAPSVELCAHDPRSRPKRATSYPVEKKVRAQWCDGQWYSAVVIEATPGMTDAHAQGVQQVSVKYANSSVREVLPESKVTPDYDVTDPVDQVDELCLANQRTIFSHFNSSKRGSAELRPPADTCNPPVPDECWSDR